MKAKTELAPGPGIQVLAAEKQDAGWVVSAVFPGSGRCPMWPERTKRPDLSGSGTRHERYATLSANSGGVVEALARQYFPTLSAIPAIIASHVDPLPCRGRQVSPEVVGNVLYITQSRAAHKNNLLN
jgi:hypothetical protein